MRRKIVGPAVFCLLAAWGCADAEMGQSPDERWGETSETTISETIAYEETRAPDSSKTPIRQLLDLQDPGYEALSDKEKMDPFTTPDPSWFGFAPGDPYPAGKERSLGRVCGTAFNNEVMEVDELPATIEGVVTNHPQHYEKKAICGEDHRFYGTYFLQDATGSILILKDSRIADFTFGDRVRLRVRGIIKDRGTMAVIAYDKEEILEDASASDPPLTTPFEELDESFASRMGRDSDIWTQNTEFCGRLMGVDGFSVPDGLYNNYRITGIVCQEPSSQNFNQMILQNRTDECSSNPEVIWPVSFGLELGRRGVDVERGDVVTATGPVTGLEVGLSPCRWSFNMAIGTRAQLEIHDDN